MKSAKGLRQLSRSRQVSYVFNGLIDTWMGTDLIVMSVGVFLEREVTRVNMRDAAFTNHNVMEQALPQRHNAGIDSRGCFLPDHGHLQVIRLKRNLTAQFLKSGFIDVNAADVVA